MTRTARSGSKATALSATPWAKLKAGYKVLKDSSDVSDSGLPVSGSPDEGVDPTLRVCRKSKLKKKKKEKLSTKIKAMKLSKKHFKDPETIPLLTEPSINDSEPDSSILQRNQSKKKPKRAKTKKAIGSEVSAEIQTVAPTKRKKGKRSKNREVSEDRVPLIPTGEDSEAEEKEKVKTKKKRKKREVIVQSEAVATTQSRLDEERRQKRTEARRLRRQRRKVCFNCRESGHHVSECTKETTGTGICFKCGAYNHTSKKCKAKVPEGEYPYAKCFVCGEAGHLSRACPENPKGLYPHGGGCSLCGSVEHFKANCPSKHQAQAKRRREGMPSVGRLTSSHGSVDAEDFDELDTRKTKSKSKPAKSGPKFVSF